MMTRKLLSPLIAALMLSACAVGPNYRTPTAGTETAFKEADGWTPATPMDAIDRGAWWSAYHDPALDDLEQRLAASNQTLAAQLQAYKQARDVLAETEAAFFPVLSATGSGQKSGGRGLSPSGTAVTRYAAAADAAWTVDLWGRIRRQIEQGRANAQASAADLANVRLSLQATLAIDYFQLRAADAQKDLLAATVANDIRALTLTENQYAAGVAARGDVISARTQLETAQASLIDVTATRAQLEHAIAVLVGQTPQSFSLAPAPLPQTTPVAPLNLAGTLLQRRPDVAAAERAAAAASAGIGMARSAYFPEVTLSASDSTAAARTQSLFKAATSSWAYGASAAVTVFDFGAREARVRGAKAVYNQRVAEYRQTVLTAFQQVEDQIASLRTLEAEAGYRDQALADARAAEAIALNQYRSGTVNYAVVIQAQNTALSAAQNALSTQRARLVVSVSLIEALGGGWR
jgi:NodT family efflux transporter outer membrane factor (OMF) lipoprotein